MHRAAQDADFLIADRFCRHRGDGWSVTKHLGKGGTAPVFELSTPEGIRALKINDLKFSSGTSGEIEEQRIQKQLDLCGHECRRLIQVYDGGKFEDRLFLLMSRAPGQELQKRLGDPCISHSLELINHSRFWT